MTRVRFACLGDSIQPPGREASRDCRGQQVPGLGPWAGQSAAHIRWDHAGQRLVLLPLLFLHFSSRSH